MSHYPSPLGPPCPKCGELGRRNQQARLDKKYRCVNMSCDVLFYSFEEAIQAERCRMLKVPLPEIESKKEAVQENLFGRTKRTA